MRTQSDSETTKVGLISPITKPRSVRVSRTYLSMAAPTLLTPGAPPSRGAALVRLAPCSVPLWRGLYAQIGGPWHWHDRDAWPDSKLETHLARKGVRIYRVDASLPTGEVHGAGFFELERHADGSVEIGYLGLDTKAIGVGLGRWIVAEATREAWGMGATKVWLHSCTLDGPAALPNYLARGFTVDHTEEYDTIIQEPIGAD